jgi:hypothetical protein
MQREVVGGQEAKRLLRRSGCGAGRIGTARLGKGMYVVRAAAPGYAVTRQIGVQE